MSSAGLRQRRRGGSPEAPPKRTLPTISLESFDLYTKVRDEGDGDTTVQTSSGATVALLSFVLCLILAFFELRGWLIPVQREHMVVDPVVEDRLRINFDITFPSLTCSEANLDAMDVAGEQQNGLAHDILKMRLDSQGRSIGDAYAHSLDEAKGMPADDHAPLPPDYCGPCYGAQTRGDSQCCNTCDDVRAAYGDKGWDLGDITSKAEQCVREHRGPAAGIREGEGCRLTGHMLVNKVAGNFHIAMGETHTRGSGHIHQFNPFSLGKFNASHILHRLSFGEPYPGQRNPLDGTAHTSGEGSGVFMYFIKVIPTVYAAGGGVPALKTNQYSVTSQYRPALVNGMRQNVLPGVFFVYDISPFQVTVTEHTTPTLQMLTSLAAILGGVITAAGLVDSLLYHGTKGMGGGSAKAASGGKGGAAGLIGGLLSGGGGAASQPPAASGGAGVGGEAGHARQS